MTDFIKLTGRIFLTFEIETTTGLHIGGSNEGISIGGVNNTVIRNPFNRQPYIPGSSLRGKIRSLVEKYEGLPQNTPIDNVRIHTCQDKKDPTQAELEELTKIYQACPVCCVFGVPGERQFDAPTLTRLIVRDVALTKKSKKKLRSSRIRTDLPFTEVKTEVTIDRLTAAAVPRQMERVPGGAVFGPAEMVYTLYEGNKLDSQTDLNHFKTVITGLQLLEDDYLGGLGSRGSGRVKLQDIKVGFKSNKNYNQPKPTPIGNYTNLPDLAANLEKIMTDIKNDLQP